jgi:3-methylcrotonyl-CoA carboxylase beta subunit
MTDALTSQTKPSSPEFQQNREHHLRTIEELQALVAAAKLGGGPDAVARHHKRGKLLPRERIAAILDPGAPFLELSTLAAHGLYGGDAPSAGVVTGIGLVEGREVMIVANDATVKGGTYFPMTVKKHVRAQEIALENRLPCIYLVDSGGAFLPLQADVFPDRDHFGRIFYNQARMSALAHPAGRGGARFVHGRWCLRAGDERREHHREGQRHDLPRWAAAREGRHRRGRLGRGSRRRRRAHAPVGGRRPLRRRRTARAADVPFDRGAPEHRKTEQLALQSPEDPLYDPEELLGVLPRDTRTPYDVREVIARLVDGSRLHEFKARYGTTLVTASRTSTACPWASSPTTASCSRRARRRLRTSSSCAVSARCRCCSCRTSRASWWAASTRPAASPRTARRWCRRSRPQQVPKFTVLIGGSFGAGNYGMCGRAYQPRFLFTWPNSRISVMGGEQAAGVLVQVKKDQLEEKGQQLSADDEQKMRAPILEKYETEGHPLYATARLWDDGVIDPRQTRAALALGLSASLNAPIEDWRAPVFRM